MCVAIQSLSLIECTIDPQRARSRLAITAPLATTRTAIVTVSILSTAQNHLIELLPRKARLRVLAICEPVELVMAQVLSEVGMPTRHVYFPTKGFISLVTPSNGTAILEGGLIG